MPADLALASAPAADREFSRASVTAAAGASVGLLFGPLSVTVIPLGLFMVEMSKEFGWHRTTFFLVMMVSAWTAAIVAPITGRFIDKVGVRRVVIPGAFLYGLATASMALVDPAIWKVVLFSILVGIMAGVQSPIGFVKVVASWFNRRRAIVLAATTALGVGVGAASVPYLVHAVIAAHGWRAAYVTLGVIVSVVATPSLYFLLKVPETAPGGAALTPESTAEERVAVRRMALRSRAFWLILFGSFVTVGPMTAILAHGFALVTDRGVGADVATSVLALMGVGGTLGQLVSGYFFDKFQTPKVAIPAYGIGLLGFWLIQVGTTAPVLLAAGLLLGIGRGAEGVVPAYFTTRYFGLAAFGQIYGLIYGASVIASGIGPVVMGMSFDRSGSYGAAMIASEIGFALCLVAMMALGPYRYSVAGARHGEAA